MERDIGKLLEEIRHREEQLEAYFEQKRDEFRYSLKGRRVRFAYEIRKLNRRYRIGLLPYLLKADPLSVLTAPLIYAMVIPLLAVDASMTLYQHICFRAYGIPRVKRQDYVIIDRHKLDYLNIIEKFNCAYCGYGNGVMAYVREIIARTEQHWCPIRHARRVKDAHDRYSGFLSFGDAKAYQLGLEELRQQLKTDKPDTTPEQ